MKPLKKHIIATMVLGIMALFSGLLSHLALTDIYHGEADVTLEWRIVQGSALVILAFIVTAMFALGRVLRRI